MQKSALFDIKNPISPIYKYTAEQLLESQDIQDLITDESFLAIAQEYFGCRPMLDNTTMWWSAPFDQKGASEAAQMYHFDLDRIKFLKFFIYLTDVDSDNGPHCYVKGSLDTPHLTYRLKVGILGSPTRHSTTARKQSPKRANLPKRKFRYALPYAMLLGGCFSLHSNLYLGYVHNEDIHEFLWIEIYKRKAKALLSEGRTTHEEMAKWYSKSDMVELCGEKGTIIISDTIGFHKGKPLVKGHRLIFEVIFAINTFGANYPKIKLSDDIGTQMGYYLEKYPDTYAQKFENYSIPNKKG